MPKPAAGSRVAVDHLFEQGSPALAEAAQACADAEFLGHLALRWYADTRPALRDALIAFVRAGVAGTGKRAIFKRLYKLAEVAQDHALVAELAVAFDRLPVRRMRHRRLSLVRRYAFDGKAPAVVDPNTGKRIEPPDRDVFTLATRRYLQRRAWRTLRGLGASDPPAYRAAAIRVLAAQRDDLLADGGQLLGAWTLLHVLYHHSPALVQERAGWDVAPGHVLADASFAPAFPAAWDDPHALLALLGAPASIARRFAIHQLGQLPGEALATLGPAGLAALLESTEPGAAELVGPLLAGAAWAAKMRVGEWLALLDTPGVAAQVAVGGAFLQHVAPDRLDDATLVRLVQLPHQAVARAALDWLKARPIRGAEALWQRLPVANATACGRDARDWLVALLRGSPDVDVTHARDLLDSRSVEARKAAMEWIAADERFRADPVLLVNAAESPWPDVQSWLVAHVAAVHATLPAGSLRHLAASTVLAIYGRGRARQRVLSLVADRVIADPDARAALLPVLGVALRSVRHGDRLAALAAIGRAGHADAALRAEICAAIPDLEFPEGA